MNNLVKIFVADEWSEMVLRYAVFAFQQGLQGSGIGVSLHKLDGTPVVIFSNEKGRMMDYSKYTERFASLCDGLQDVERQSKLDTL